MSGDVNAAAETIRLILDHRDNCATYWQRERGRVALDALVAEVERLRAERDAATPQEG